jgi:RNA polymerase sigma factor (sigma-70 family)
MSHCPRSHDISLQQRLRQYQQRLKARNPTLGPAAQDLASEALARALARPAPDGNDGAWGEGILRHVLADHLRRHARTARALGTLLASPPGPEATPEEVLLARERRHLLLQALPTLPPELAELLRARFWDELDDDAVARAQGIAVPTVRTRMHRALTRLRAVLGQLRGLALWCGPQPAALALMPLALTAVMAVGGEQLSPPIAARTPPAVVTPSARPLPAPVVRVPAPPPSPARPRAAAPASAPPQPPAGAVLRMTFADDQITAELQRPDDLLFVGPPAATRQSSLLEIPASFTAAIIKMVEDL